MIVFVLCVECFCFALIFCDIIQSSDLRSFISLDFNNRQTLYDQVEGLIAENTQLLTPLDMVMHFFNDLFFDCPLPDASTMSMQRVASLSDHGGLWLVNSAREVVSVAVVAQISPYGDDLKCGEYLDMTVYNQEVCFELSQYQKYTSLFTLDKSGFTSKSFCTAVLQPSVYISGLFGSNYKYIRRAQFPL